MLESLTHVQFDECLNQTFRVRLDSSYLDFELIKVDKLGSGDPGGSQRQPFSLMFRAMKEVNLPQRIYRMEHEAMGTLDIFIVPIGADDSGMLYEAVFT